MLTTLNDIEMKFCPFNKGSADWKQVNKKEQVVA